MNVENLKGGDIMPKTYYDKNSDDRQQIKCLVKNHLITLREGPGGWTREVNIVSWEDMPSKLDIREWNKDKTKSSKGLTFTRPEVERLRDILNIINLELIEDRTDRRYNRNDSSRKTAANPEIAPIAEYVSGTTESAPVPTVPPPESISQPETITSQEVNSEAQLSEDEAVHEEKIAV